jgi:hypothetical protein
MGKESLDALERPRRKLHYDHAVFADRIRNQSLRALLSGFVHNRNGFF